MTREQALHLGVLCDLLKLYAEELAHITDPQECHAIWEKIDALKKELHEILPPQTGRL